MSSRLITLVAPWRRLVAMQSVPVSPPPMTITCGVVVCVEGRECSGEMGECTKKEGECVVMCVWEGRGGGDTSHNNKPTARRYGLQSNADGSRWPLNPEHSRRPLATTNTWLLTYSKLSNVRITLHSQGAVRRGGGQPNVSTRLDRMCHLLHTLPHPVACSHHHIIPQATSQQQKCQQPRCRQAKRWPT